MDYILKLPETMVQLILDMAGDHPAKQSMAVILEIQRQAREQVQAAQQTNGAVMKED